MSFKIRFALSAMAVLFFLAMPQAAENWIIQSVSQEIGNIDDCSCLQSSIQISGSEKEDIFILQQMNQVHGRDNPRGTDELIQIQRDGAISQEISPAHLIEVMKDIRSKGDASGIDFCRTDIENLKCMLGGLENHSEDRQQEIIDIHFSPEAIAQLDELIANLSYDYVDAPESGYHTYLASNGGMYMIVPGFHLENYSIVFEES